MVRPQASQVFLGIQRVTRQEQWKSLRSQSLRAALQRALQHFAGPLEELEVRV